MPILGAISLWLENTFLPYQGVGLMVMAIGDSSFLSLPEVNDGLLMTFSIAKPERMLGLATLTTLGSIIGCSLLYAVGRKGGEAFLSKRFAGERMARVRGWYKKFGLLAVIVPSLLPPPTPFKIFVLSAGAFGISWPRFLVAVTVGRGLRYFSEGYLAVWYGQAAIDLVKQNVGKVGLGVAAVVVASAVVFAIAHRRVRMKSS